MKQAGKSDKANNLLVELSAGLLLLFVALPLNIGVAFASGVSAERGIVSGLIGALVTGAISKCSVLVSGPDAGIGVLLVEMLGHHGVSSLSTLVLLAGLIQVAIGASRSSKWFRMVSPAVVNGMLAGMGLLIIFTQFHIMLDDVPKATGFANLLAIPGALLEAVPGVDGKVKHIPALIGLFTIIVAYAWSKVPKTLNANFPPALLALLLAAGLTYWLRFDVQTVKLAAIALNPLAASEFSGLLGRLAVPSLWGSAFMLAVILSAQTIITLSAIEKASDERKRIGLDRELLAQGVGNIICGMVGALPVVGVLLRSITNLHSGATTKIPNYLHGGLMLAVVALLPKLLEFIPTCALAAVLVFIGTRMTWEIFYRCRQFAREEMLILILTVGSILFTNLFVGIVIGLVAATLKELYKLTAVFIRVDNVSPTRTVINIEGALIFMHIPKLQAALEKWSPGSEMHVRFDHVNYIDHACMQMLMEWENQHPHSLVIDWGSAVVLPEALVRTQKLQYHDRIEREKVSLSTGTCG